MIKMEAEEMMVLKNAGQLTKTQCIAMKKQAE